MGMTMSEKNLGEGFRPSICKGWRNRDSKSGYCNDA